MVDAPIRKIIVCLLFFCTLTSCGYKMGFTTPPKYKTIAVPIFKNSTLYRDYEFTLTSAVKAEILTRTPLHFASESKADTILHGRITRIHQATITKEEDRLASRLDVTLWVEISWKDRRTNQWILPPVRLAETVEIITNRGENLEGALDKALRRIARYIVFRLDDNALMKDGEKDALLRKSEHGKTKSHKP